MVVLANKYCRTDNILLEPLMMQFLEIKNFVDISLSHVFREFNSIAIADQLSEEALFKGGTQLLGFERSIF